MSYNQELRLALLAVQRASRLTRSVSLSSTVGAVTKSDASPVTIADYGAQALVIKAIKNVFKGDGVIGEEDSSKLKADSQLSGQVWEFVEKTCKESEQELNKADSQLISRLTSETDVQNTIDEGNAEGGAKGRFWALDPVDGTKGFLRKEQYAVCLALVQDAKVMVGVIGCPNLGSSVNSHTTQGSLFYAVRGQGAYQLPLYEKLPENDDKLFDKSNQIHFNDSADLSECTFCESVESGHSSHGQQAEIAKLLGITKPPVRMDSQAKYCSISRGQGDVYLRLPNPKYPNYVEKIWDHAAGNVIVSEAGGIVTDMHGNELNFGVGRTLAVNKGVIAASKQVHEKVVQAVKEVVDRN